ncbi:MAG: hypothetical protein DRP42_04365, partial [Tenericutes bacterium]
MKIYRPTITDIAQDLIPSASGTLQVGTAVFAFSDGVFNNLQVNSEPTGPLGVATKGYVDTQVSGIDEHNELGNLDWSVAAHVIDSNITPNASGTIDLGTVTLAYDDAYIDKIHLEADPTTPLQAATKQYVDTQAEGASNWSDEGGYLKPLTDGDDIRVYDSGGADYIELSLDGTESWMKWNDGELWLQSQEVNTSVTITGNTGGQGQLTLMDGDDADDYLRIRNTNTVTNFYPGSNTTAVIFNGDGYDVDYTFESDNNPAMLKIMGDDTGVFINQTQGNDALTLESVGGGLKITDVGAGYLAADIYANAASGGSYGVRITAGTTTADYALWVDQRGGTDLFHIDGIGAVWHDAGNTVHVPIGGDIEAYIAAAAAGDTIALAAGTYTITDDIDIAKSINIVGQGVGHTTIACATADKNMFDIDADDVRIAELSMTYAGDNTNNVAIKALSVVGLVIENVNITMTGNGNKIGIDLDTAATAETTAIIRNVVISAISDNNASYGIWLTASGTSGNTSVVDIYNCNVTASSSGAVECSAYYVQDSSATVDGFMNVYNSIGTSSSAGDALGVKTQNGNAIFNSYNSTFSAGTYDVKRVSGTLTLYDTTLVNNTTSGTITYGGTVVSESFQAEPDSDTVGGIIASRAKMGMPTGGAGDYAYFGHIDSFGAGANYAVAQGAGGGTHINAITGNAVLFSVNNVGVGQISDSLFQLTQNSDTLTFTGDGTDWYQKWSDGALYLQTDEGTDTAGVVWAKNKGTAFTYLGAESPAAHVNLFAGTSASSLMYTTSLTLYAQPYANRGTTTNVVANAVFSSTENVMNEGSADIDFRVESDNLTHALFVQGSDGFVGIGKAAPETLLELYNSGNYQYIHISNAVTGSTLTDGMFIGIDEVGNSMGILCQENYPLTFNTNSTEVGRWEANGVFKLTQNSDTLTFTGDGTDWYQQWSDGFLYLKSTEAAFSGVILEGTGDGYAFFRMSDATNANYYADFTQSETGFVIDFGTAMTTFTINEAGRDVDFRVESENVTDAFKIDAGTDTASFGVDVELGNIEIEEDAGAVTLVNMSVSATPGAGTEESYSFQIDDTDILKVYAEADSAGGIQNQHTQMTGHTVSTNFQKITTFGTFTLFVSDGTTAEGALTGVEGDICLNGGTGAGQMAYCDADGTNWTDM